MSIHLSIFLYLYLAFLVLWVAFSIVALYHMFKFGFKNFATYFSIVVYMAVAIVIFGMSFFYISQIDWSINILNISHSKSVMIGWK